MKAEVKVAQSCLTLCNPMDYTVPGILQARILELGSLSLLQGIFPTQGSNPGLLHCRWILYQLSHKESPRTLKWVAFPFFRGSSWPRDRTGVSCIAGRFFTNWATREHLWCHLILQNLSFTESTSSLGGRAGTQLILGPVFCTRWNNLSIVCSSLHT